VFRYPSAKTGAFQENGPQATREFVWLCVIAKLSSLSRPS
jgi:hypothetical protein